MSLLGAHKMGTNDATRARIEMAMRQTVAAKRGTSDQATALCDQVAADSSVALPHFLAAASVNVSVAASACESCGHVTESDDALLYVVQSAWDEVAELLFPAPPDPTT